MLLGIFILLCFPIYSVIMHLLGRNIVKTWKNPFFLIAFIGVFIRVITATIIVGHPTDMNCFRGWATQLFENGLPNFYASEGFTDYPPGYMYILYIIGAIRGIFNIDYHSSTFLLLIKLPSIMADVLAGLFLLKMAKSRMKPNYAIAIALMYVLNPVTILNTSFWGQVDSVHTLTILISIYFLTEKKLLKSLLLFVVSFIIKPQAFMFSPIYLFFMFCWLKERKWSSKAFLTLLKYAGICISLVIILLFPFANWAKGYPDFQPILQQYIATLGSYNYTTVNAYNIYALFQKNWVPASELFLFIPYSIWGLIALVLIVIFAFYLLKRANVSSNYFFTSAMIGIATFLFSIKMHERYCFPILVLLLAAYIYRQDKRILYVFAGFTVTLTIHYIDVLNMTIRDYNYDLIKTSMVVISFMIIVVFIYMLFVTFKVFKKDQPDKEYDKTSGDLKFLGKKNTDSIRTIQKSETPIRYTRVDIIAVAAITLVYCCVAFFQLGDRSGVETPYITTTGDETIIDFGAEQDISRVQYMLNSKEKREFSLYFSNDNIIYGDEIRIIAQSVFTWEDTKLNKLITISETVKDENNENINKTFTLDISPDKSGLLAINDSDETVADGYSDNVESRDITANNVDENSVLKARYVKMIVLTNDFRLNEMAFRDASDNIIPIINISNENANSMFDEQSLVPESKTYMNSMYFDEIYHGRTGYEYINGLNVYEYTHPPLGKLFIATGISVFGMNPFGWRFFGTLFGVFMCPLMFVFARKLLKTTFWASFVTIVFSFDFMHYTQTRIATIDTYIVFFVIAMYYFMYKYYCLNYNDSNTKFSKTLIPLLLSGICMGLGIASKWPGAYAAAGIAIIFFISMFKRFLEYRYICKNPTDDNLIIRQSYVKKTVITLAFCVLFFVIIPTLIYFASYIPYYFGEHGLYPNRDNIWFWRNMPWLKTLMPDTTIGNFVAAVCQGQVDIYRYHANLVSEHPYSSEWFSWPVIGRPIYYYSNVISEKLSAGISSFGNPAVWWGGLVAFIYMIIRAIKLKSRRAIFLIIAYFAQIVPWMLVSRTTYIYHYFPCVPFLAISLGLLFKDISNIIKTSGIKKYLPAIIFMCIVIILFIMFYPVLTGTPVSVWYVKHFLKWLPSWVLISG